MFTDCVATPIYRKYSWHSDKGIKAISINVDILKNKITESGLLKKYCLLFIAMSLKLGILLTAH